MKIGVAPVPHTGINYNSTNQNIGQKNVRIMLVGNGNKSSQQTYKQMNEMKGLHFSPTAGATGGLSMIQPGSIPKTTKNNQKYYSQGNSTDLMGQQLL